jgi:hypothetical protein
MLTSVFILNLLLIFSLWRLVNPLRPGGVEKVDNNVLIPLCTLVLSFESFVVQCFMFYHKGH